jgi:hypothetical protein
VVNRIVFTVVPPDTSQWQRMELRPVVDGQDVLGAVFSLGPGEDPDLVLGPDSPLLPGDTPRRVRIAETDCTEGCCGALHVRIRQDGDHVVWDQWENTSDGHDPTVEFRFDVEQYRADLDRLHVDRSWEWPGVRLAATVRHALGPSVLDRWDCSVSHVTGYRATVDVTFFTPSLRGRRRGEFTRLRRSFAVTDEPFDVQTEEIVNAFQTADPREGAEFVDSSVVRMT